MSEEKENNTKVMDKKIKNADTDKSLKNKKESKKEKKLSKMMYQAQDLTWKISLVNL